MSRPPTHVRLTTSFPEWPLLRQTPGGRGTWGDCVFHVDEPVETCDWWIVYDALPEPQSARCPPEHTVFITGEPPALRTYAPEFLAQFAHVITSHPGIEHPGVSHRPQGLPWHIGVRRDDPAGPQAALDYDALLAMEPVTKTKDLSVLCSDKRMSAGHRLRLRFLRHLRAHFGDRLDVFGEGHDAVADKWDAIAPYRFHICFENCSIEDYFTESLTDVWLGEAFPLYWGCTNLATHAPPDAFRSIDIRNPARAIAAIESALEEGLSERRSAALREARSQVLERHNLFALLASFCDEGASASPQQLSLAPEVIPLPRGQWLRRLGGRVRSRLRTRPLGGNR